jgi:hypothetical protein
MSAEGSDSVIVKLDPTLIDMINTMPHLNHNAANHVREALQSLTKYSGAHLYVETR